MTDTNAINSSALVRRLRPRVLLHADCGWSTYDMLTCGISGRRWAFGAQLCDYQDRRGPHRYGLRILVWRWHLCWRLTGIRPNTKAEVRECQ